MEADAASALDPNDDASAGLEFGPHRVSFDPCSRRDDRLAVAKLTAAAILLVLALAIGWMRLFGASSAGAEEPPTTSFDLSTLPVPGTD